MLSQIFTGQLLIYMIAKFQWMGCEHLVAKAKIVNDKTKENEAYRCVGHRTAPDFRADMRAAVDAIRPLYAQILIKCSDYSNTHKDRLFFEAFYATLGYTCISVLSNHQGGNRGPQIDGDGQESIMSKMVQIDVGGIFRTNYYNNAPPSRRPDASDRYADLLAAVPTTTRRKTGQYECRARHIAERAPSHVVETTRVFRGDQRTRFQVTEPYFSAEVRYE